MGLRNWLLKLVSDAVDSRFDEVCKEILLVEKMIDDVKAQIGGVVQGIRLEEKVEEVQPLRSTRPSWPRMRRLLEERDVRATMNPEADRVQAYWENKENQHGKSG